jgi:hypothetical protein
MSEETNEVVQDEQSKFILTDELREKASKKPVFKILYITDGDSRLRPFRGEVAVRNFAEFYRKQAEISYMTASSSKLATLTKSDLEGINILWIDNATDFKAAKNLSELHVSMFDDIDPEWKETIEKLEQDEDKSKVEAYVQDLGKKRENKLRIIYALDEFVWEGPIGRSHDIQSVQIIETFVNIADVIVVPTVDLKGVIKNLNEQARVRNVRPLVLDANKPIAVIPTAMNLEFSPVYKNFTRNNIGTTQLTMNKPKVLIKGLSIPENVEEFIMDNHRKMDITICSVDEVNPHILGLMQRGKVKHIYHWANPYVNSGNIYPTYAIERDIGFDFVIHTLSEDLLGRAYELSCGEEDILFSVSYGALPICGIDHIIPDGTDKEDADEIKASMMGFAAGLTFGKNTPAKQIRAMIEAHKIPVRWNESYNKYRPYVEGRLITSPNIINGYFVIMLGKEMAMAREALATETRLKMEAEADAQKAKIESTQDATPVQTEPASDKLIDVEININKGQ